MNATPDKINPLAELGSTGLNRWGGLVYEEFLHELQGIRGVKIYKEMSENDPICSAILFTIEMLIRNVKWSVEPASSDQDDLAAADFLESCLDDMEQPWSDTIAEIMSMVRFGWSLHEVVYRVRSHQLGSRNNDNRIGWRKLPIRSQDTLYQWDFDEAGDVCGFRQQPPPDYRLRYIPMAKALLFRTTSFKNSPEGRSVLRGAYQPWFFKKHIERIEAIGIERDLTGLPILHVPPRLLDPNASAEDRAALEAYKKIARNLKRDEQEGVVWPLAYDDNGRELYRLSLLSTGGTRQFDTNAIINRYDQRIAMQVLADFILLGHEKVGSFALNSSKTNLFATAIGAWLGSIAGVFNRVAIPQLFRLNGFQIKKLPQLTHGDIESVDLTELGQFITQLSGAGAQLFPDEDLENWLKRQAKMPVRDTHATFAEEQALAETAGEQIVMPTADEAIDSGKVPAIQQMIASVARREIPRDSAIQMMIAAFHLKPELAERIMGETGRTFFAQAESSSGGVNG